MHEQVLPEGTRRLLATLASQNVVVGSYLAGGTAVALWFGHRVSDDLDFFSEKGIDTRGLIAKLRTIGDVSVRGETTGSLHVVLHGVKLSWLCYPYPLLEPTGTFLGVPVAHPVDMALIKLTAVSGRGTKRDFIDLYWILKGQGLSIEVLIDLMSRKYESVRYDTYHMLRSLSYFEDAERDPDPTMIERLNWPEIKSFFKQESIRLLREGEGRR